MVGSVPVTLPEWMQKGEGLVANHCIARFPSYAFYWWCDPDFVTFWTAPRISSSEAGKTSAVKRFDSCSVELYDCCVHVVHDTDIWLVCLGGNGCVRTPSCNGVCGTLGLHDSKLSSEIS